MNAKKCVYQETTRYPIEKKKRIFFKFFYAYLWMYMPMSPVMVSALFRFWITITWARCSCVTLVVKYNIIRGRRKIATNSSFQFQIQASTWVPSADLVWWPEWTTILRLLTLFSTKQILKTPPQPEQIQFV